ncbi:MAG TPA: cytochrome c biogenesis protein CcdA [Symbiobacteriaceae bacterium]|nr:cytochrome c biogenesis protein CcdA [Symbiobacteriaceae bacterium]
MISGVTIAFAAGLLSFLSPCIVPMLSVYFSLITGESFRSLRELTATDAVKRGVVRNTLAFVTGFAVVFTLAGAVAAQIGALLQRSLVYLNIVGGLFVIVLGLMALGLVPEGLLERLTLRHRAWETAPPPAKPWSAFVVGLFFAVACSHCIAPTLYSILILAGGSGTPVTGAVLMAAFSAGLAVPYLLAGLFMGRLVTVLRNATAPRLWVQRVAGALMVVLGALMVTGKLTWLTGAAGRLWPFRLPFGM